ncbi:MAG: hypothetical protein IT537_24590 [Hyphomicrobiales bacterium]|nr:hypothetical protein [Hyphomicrobiales bacterium]
MSARTKEEFFSELDQLDYDQVRVNLESGIYSLHVGERGQWAKEWLLRKELARASDREARSNRMTQRAHAIAIIAATAAMTSAIAAMVSSISSVILLLRK